MVRTIRLSDSKSIPAVGWGSGSGGLMRSGSKAADTGKLVLDAGIHHIDTAQYYETEEETGAAIKAAGLKPEDVWVTTKISSNTSAAEATTPEKIRQSVEESIAKLGSKPNLLLIHNPFVPEEGKIGQFWTYLEDLVLDGTLEGVSLGVSNFRPQDLEEIFKVARIQPVANQLEFHPYVLAQLEPLLELQKKHGIVTQAYGPLTPILRHKGGPLIPVLDRIAERKGTDAASVLLLWTIQKGVVAITTSANPANIAKIAALEKLEDLTEQDIKDIDEAGKQIHFRHYDEHMSKDYPAPNLPSGLEKK